VVGAPEELKELLEKLNQAAADKWQFSGKITTNAKGEAQIHCSVKSNVDVQTCADLLKDLTSRTIRIATSNGLTLAKEKVKPTG